jgi:hypothetical protein
LFRKIVSFHPLNRLPFHGRNKQPKNVSRDVGLHNELLNLRLASKNIAPLKDRLKLIGLMNFSTNSVFTISNQYHSKFSWFIRLQ